MRVQLTTSWSDFSGELPLEEKVLGHSGGGLHPCFFVTLPSLASNPPSVATGDTVSPGVGSRCAESYSPAALTGTVPPEESIKLSVFWLVCEEDQEKMLRIKHSPLVLEHLVL